MQLTFLYTIDGSAIDGRTPRYQEATVDVADAEADYIISSIREEVELLNDEAEPEDRVPAADWDFLDAYALHLPDSLLLKLKDAICADYPGDYAWAYSEEAETAEAEGRTLLYIRALPDEIRQRL